MNQEVYRHIPLQKRSFLQRLFRQQEPGNAILEVNNLLAGGDILSVQMAQILAIAQKYRLNLTKEYERNFDEFYAAYLQYCLKDQKLSENEILALKHLKGILGLTDSKINLIHEKLTGEIYRQGVKEAIANGRLSKTEETFLEKLRSELQLPQDLANKISGEERSSQVKQYLDQATEDGRFSPEEEKEFKAISKSLNISVEISGQTKAALAKMKEFWRIENNPLEVVPVDIKLQKAEQCFYTAPVKWYEMQKALAESYPRLKIVKGFYYAFGNIGGENYTGMGMKFKDSGHLYLTDKRILFIGTAGKKYLKHEQILSFSPFINGIAIEKDKGRNPFIAIHSDVEIFSIVFSRVLREFGN